MPYFLEESPPLPKIPKRIFPLGPWAKPKPENPAGISFSWGEEKCRVEDKVELEVKYKKY